MNWELFIIPVFLGATITALGWHYKMYPPKRINWWHGYRTKRTMANQEVWDYANIVGAKFIIFYGIFILTFGSLAAIVFSKKRFIVVLLVLILSGIAIGFYWCEKQLNKYFDGKGNPKTKN